MKTTATLALTILITTLAAGKLNAQNGYSVTLNPTNPVADGTSGEEVYVTWRAAPGVGTIADIVNFYRLLPNGAWDLIWFKQDLLRFNDSQYIFEWPGEYKVSYMHFYFFWYYEMAHTRITVLPTTSTITNAVNYPPRGGTIVFFGDSLTEGVGSTQSNLVDWLEAYAGYSIVNAGVSGDTTEDALLRITNSVLAHNPNIVLILLCGNDILQGLPISQTFSNLQKIVSLVQSNGALTLVMGIYNGVLEDTYREEFHELYTSTRSVFIPDILDGIANPFTTAGTHPNDEGYRRMALRIAPVLSSIMLPKLTIRQQGSQVALEWFGLTNATYDILFSENISTPRNTWSTNGTVRGAETNALITIPTGSSQSFFTLKIR